MERMSTSPGPARETEEVVDPTSATGKLLLTRLELIKAGKVKRLSIEEAEKQSVPVFAKIEEQRRKLLVRLEALEPSDEAAKKRRAALLRRLHALEHSLKL